MLSKKKVIDQLEWYIEEICKASLEASCCPDNETEEETDKRQLLAYERCALLTDCLQRFLSFFDFFEPLDIALIVNDYEARTYTRDRYTKWDERVALVRGMARNVVTLLEAVK